MLIETDKSQLKKKKKKKELTLRQLVNAEVEHFLFGVEKDFIFHGLEQLDMNPFHVSHKPNVLSLPPTPTNQLYSAPLNSFV